MNLQPQSTTTAPPPLPPVRPQEITAADAVRMRDGFLHWWHTSLECLVATQKLFRRLDDDDLTALYLAAWQFALEEMEARQPAGPGDRIIAYITQLDASHFEGATVTRYAEVTGIPRETVRRKLDKAASLMLIERVDDAQFRLRAFSTEIMPMFDNCLGLARSLMSCLNRSPTRDGNDLPAATWIALMRSYFILLLSFWAARRRQTRVSSAISIQSVIELVTVLNSYRRLAIEGMASKVDLVTFLQGAPSIRKSPYFISQLAFMSGLTVAQVRRMCRYLETQGKVEFLGPDAIRPLPLVETVSADLQQAFFSEEARIAGMRFVGIALACLAPREDVSLAGHA